jgi:hypothetical protein
MIQCLLRFPAFSRYKNLDLKTDLEVELGEMVLLLPILVLGVGDEPADLALVARGPFAAEPCVLLRVECVPIVFRHFRSCALKTKTFLEAKKPRRAIA